MLRILHGKPFGAGLLSLAVGLIWLMSGGAAEAQSTWTSSADGLWSDALNWNTPPSSSPATVLTFSGAADQQYTATNDLISFTLNRLQLDSTSTLTSLIAGNALTLAGTTPQIVQQADGAMTITNDLLLGANLTLGGDGTGLVTLAGSLQDSDGARSLTKTGASTFVLSGNNSFSGGTTVSAGVLNVQNGNALGTGGVTIASGGTIQLEGGITLNNALGLGGTGASGQGALRNISGNNTWNANIVLSAASSFASDAGTLTISSATAISAGTRTITFQGDGDFVINGNIAASGNTSTLTKNGAGTLLINGVYSGTTGTITINDGVLRYGANNVLPSSVVNINGGTLDIQTFNDLVGRSSNNGVILQNGGNLIGSGGVLTAQAGAGFIAFDLRSGYINANLAMSATRQLVKSTADTVTIASPDNSGLLGAVLIQNGLLDVQSRGGLGVGALVVAPATLDETPILSLSGADGSLLNAAGTGNANSSYLLHGAATLRFDNRAANYSGPVAGGRWHDSVAVDLNASTVEMWGNALANSFEAVGVLNLAGGTRINLARGDIGMTTILQADGLTRLDQATLTINPTSGQLGGDERITLLTPPTLTNGIVAPWVVNGADGAFVTYDATVDAAGTIGLTNAAFTSTNLNTSTGSDIVLTGEVVLTGPASAYALSATGAISGAHTVTIGSGGFLADTALANLLHTANFRFGAAGDVEGLVFVGAGGNATLAGNLTTSAGLTKFGLGTLTLIGNNNGTLDGGLRVNEGTLDVRSALAVGNNTVTLAGGRLALRNNGTGDDATIHYGFDVAIAGNTRSTIHVGNAGANLGNVIELGNLAFDAGSSLLVTAADGYRLAFTGSNNITLPGTVVIGGPADLALLGDGSIQGAGGFTKQGSGTLTIAGSGTHTYSGNNQIAEGALRLQNVSGLGSTAGTTLINTGAALELDFGHLPGGGATITGQSVTIAGSTATGSLRNVSGDNHWNATVLMTGTTVIASDAGTLRVGTGSGNALQGNLTLTLTGAGDGIVDGNRTSTTRTLTKSGSGKWTLLGSSANTTGSISLSAGTLNLQHSEAVGVNTSAGTGRLTITAGATLELEHATGITIGVVGDMNARPLTLNGTGVNGVGAIRNVAGNNAWLSDITLASTTVIASDAGTLTLGQSGSQLLGNLTLTLTGDGDGVIAADRMSTTRTLTKNGEGRWSLLGTSANISGGVTINLGALNIQNSTALGIHGGTYLVTVNNGGTLELEGNIGVLNADANGRSLNLNGANTEAALRNVSGDNAWLGLVSLTTNAGIFSDSETLTIGNGGNALALATSTTNRILTLGGDGNGIINGTITAPGTSADGGLIKVGTGTWTLLDAGLYAGNTDILGGTLRVLNQQSLGTGGLRLLPNTLGGTARLIVEGELGTLAAVSDLGNANSSFSMGGNTTLTFDNTTLYNGASAHGRWHDSVGLTLESSTLQLIGNAGAATTERIGALSFNGSSTIELQRLAAGVATTLEINGDDPTNTTAALLRPGRGTLKLVVTPGQLGGDERLLIVNAAAPQQTAGLNGGSDTMVAPYILNSTDRTFVAYDDTLGLINATFSADTLATSTVNSLVNTAGASLAGNALTFALKTTGDISSNDGHLVSVYSGGLISDGLNLNHTANFLFGGGLGDAEALIYVSDGGTTTFAGTLASTVGLTKFGQGTLVLGTDNSATLVGGGAVFAEGLVRLAANNALGAASNTLRVSGATLDMQSFSTSASTVTLQRDGSIVGSGLLTGDSYEIESGLLAVDLAANAATLTKTTAGVAILSGNNQYTGLTSINEGVLIIQHVNALGSTTGATTLATGAELQIDIAASLDGFGNPITNIIAENFTAGTSSVIRNRQGDTTLTGVFTLSSSSTASTFVSEAGTLTIGVAGQLNLNGNRAIILAGDGDGFMVGNRSATTRSLTKQGFGKWTLLGTSALTTGSTTVSQGILNVQNQAALGQFTTASTGTTTVSSGATLEIEAPAGGGFVFGRDDDPLVRRLNINGAGFNGLGALRNVSGDNVWYGNVTLPGTATIVVEAGSSLVIGGADDGLGNRTVMGSSSTSSRTVILAGDGLGVLAANRVTVPTLIKNGFGTWILSGSSDGTTQATTINSGILNVQHSEALGQNLAGSTGLVTVTSGLTATLQLQGDVTIGLASDPSVRPLQIFGAGDGGLGALRGVAGNNAWLGNIQLGSNATISVDAGSTLNLGGAVSVDNVRSVMVSTSSTTSRTLTLAGDGSGILASDRVRVRTLVKEGLGTWVLTGSSDGTNQLTTINAGALNLQHNEALGVNDPTGDGLVTVASNAALQLEGNVTIGNLTDGAVRSLQLGGHGIGNTGALRGIAGDNTWLGNISLTANSTLGSDAGVLTIGSSVSSVTLSDFTLTLTGAGAGQVAAQIGGGGSASINKVGAGSWNLAGQVDVGGSVAVNDGRLAVHATLASGSGVVVNAGGTLAGTGAILADVTINSGGLHAPGNSVGNQQVASETWNGGGRFEFELASVTGSAGLHWDLLTVTGDLTMNATAADPFVISVVPLANPSDQATGPIANWDAYQSYSWMFATANQIQYSGSDPLSSVFAFDLSTFNNFHGGSGVTVANFGVFQQDQSLYISYTAVPEPGSLLLVGVGSLGLAGYGWRRRRRLAKAIPPTANPLA